MVSLRSSLETEQGSTAPMVLGPVLSPLTWRGKFIYRPRLVKWLGKMRFLAGPGHHVVDGALL
jgi:hypothetical protein